MAAKAQKKFLASVETLMEIEDLVGWFPDQTQTEIFTKAIHLLWVQTNKVRNPLRCEHCKTAFNYHPHLDAYVQQCDCE